VDAPNWFKAPLQISTVLAIRSFMFHILLLKKKIVGIAPHHLNNNYSTE